MNLQENINRIKEVMGINESEANKEIQFVKIYSDGGGSDDAAEFEGEVISIPIVDTIPNEPFKDTSYMENSDNIKNMVKSINDGDELPPIKVIQHPYSDSKYVVVDGNHRRFAFSKSDKKEIDAVVIPHENVLLMKNEWGEEPEEYVKLSDVLNNKKVIDKYFVLPDGSNNFEALDKSEVSEKKESGEKWIKCVNCKKKFTQTIHKGKKSLPVCPHCGTNNGIISESEISPYIRRRLLNDLPEFIRNEYQWLAHWSFKTYDEYISKVIFNVVREITNSIADLNYEETIKLRENIEPFIAKYIVDNFSDEIEEYYVNNL
jgi:DNA-directed RNA polymerase subunit RPC12/RpoP